MEIKIEKRFILRTFYGCFPHFPFKTAEIPLQKVDKICVSTD